MLLAALPFFAAQRWVWRLTNIQTRHIAIALGCMMFSNIAMQLIMIAAPAKPYGLGRIIEIVIDKDATSYFLDATRVDAQIPRVDWLDHYDTHLPAMTIARGWRLGSVGRWRWRTSCRIVI